MKAVQLCGIIDVGFLNEHVQFPVLYFKNWGRWSLVFYLILIHEGINFDICRWKYINCQLTGKENR